MAAEHLRIRSGGAGKRKPRRGGVLRSPFRGAAIQDRFSIPPAIAPGSSLPTCAIGLLRSRLEDGGADPDRRLQSRCLTTPCYVASYRTDRSGRRSGTGRGHTSYRTPALPAVSAGRRFLQTLARSGSPVPPMIPALAGASRRAFRVGPPSVSRGSGFPEFRSASGFSCLAANRGNQSTALLSRRQ